MALLEEEIDNNKVKIERLTQCLKNGERICKNGECNNLRSKLFDYCFECAPLHEVDMMRHDQDDSYRRYIQRMPKKCVLYKNKIHKIKLGYPKGEYYIITDDQSLVHVNWKTWVDYVYQLRPEESGLKQEQSDQTGSK